MSIRPAAAAQPLRYWRTEQLERLERLLGQALRSWASDWGLPEDVARVSCHRAAACAEGATQGTTLRGPEGALAWLRDASWTGALAEELFGHAGGTGAIVEEVARACVDDFTRRLVLALAMPGALPERTTAAPHYGGPWSGQVWAVLPFDGALLMNCAAVDACLGGSGVAGQPRSLPGSSAAMPLLQAAAAQRLALQAQLAPCEIDLGVLQDLRPGDVLRIPHPLDAPLQVRTESGATLFSGHLASSRGRKVIELSATA
ncbi:MAG TPA: FliM/FliN family flagellar motor switch protein [Ramlibacter sp.]|uniref:FliM/FliN family flagellar motor switch protein n=1 Tax=Ramlibacter sp. TaxID=1917967 RepID=UPI002ED053C7